MTIHPWDKVSKAEGAAMLLRDYCNIHILEAKRVIEVCKDGGTRTIQVPFSKKVTLAAKLLKRGFQTS